MQVENSGYVRNECSKRNFLAHIHEGRLSGTEYLQIAQMHKARGMPILGKYQETQSK